MPNICHPDSSLLDAAPSLLVRADAGARLGAGHVMRCLALAQAWQAIGGQAIFALAATSAALEARIIDEGMKITHVTATPGSIEDASEVIALAQQTDAYRVVTDGYHFNGHYQSAIKKAGLQLLFIDDYGQADYYAADLVLNQNLYAREETYQQRAAYTRLLLGTRYVLMRHEFWPWRNWTRVTQSAALHILVTLGGGDLNNTSRIVIQALRLLKRSDLDIKIVVGPANSYHNILLQEIEQMPCKTQLLTAVTDMPSLMAWADLAVSAAGSTCWELAFMGVPSVTIIQAENQRYIAESLADAGIASNAGWYTDLCPESLSKSVAGLLLSPDVRTQMSYRGRAIVDGMGAQRVAETLSPI